MRDPPPPPPPPPQSPTKELRVSLGVRSLDEQAVDLHLHPAGAFLTEAEGFAPGLEDRAPVWPGPARPWAVPKAITQSKSC